MPNPNLSRKSNLAGFNKHHDKYIPFVKSRFLGDVKQLLDVCSLVTSFAGFAGCFAYTMTGYFNPFPPKIA
jgi:hypothetical protein